MMICITHVLLIDHLMVQGSLSLGIFLFPDLLGQSSWKVLADDLITMFVALVVLRNCEHEYKKNLLAAVIVHMVAYTYFLYFAAGRPERYPLEQATPYKL